MRFLRALALICALEAPTAEVQQIAAPALTPSGPTPATPSSAPNATIAAPASARAGHILNVIDYFGALGDVTAPSVMVSIAGGSNALTATGANFNCTKLNAMATAGTPEIIEVPGAGPAGAALETTISSCQSETQVTLAANASQGLVASVKTIVFGADDSTAFTLCLTKAHPCTVPAAIHFAKNVVLSTGGALIGEAPQEYGDTPQATQVRPMIIASPGATSILNPNGASHIALRGLYLDCNNESGANGIAGGGTQLEIYRLTIQSCPGDGLGGGANHYTRDSTIIDSEFIWNGIGVSDLIDGVMVGGAVTSSTGDGIYQGDGADANNFVGVRTEWNAGNGYHFYEATLNQIVGGLIDRNYLNGIYAASSQVTITGTILRRNGAANTGNWLADSQIAVEGSTTKLTLNSVQSLTGTNDDGSGNLTPKYFIFNNTSSRTPGSVAITSSDVSGYVTAFSQGGTPTSYLLRGNTGVTDFSNFNFPAVSRGKSLWSAGQTNINAGNTGTATITVDPPFTANGSRAPFAHHLFLYAVDYSTGAVHTANFDLSGSTSASGGSYSLQAGNVYGEGGGTGYFQFSASSGSIQLSTSGFTTNGNSYTLSIKNTSADQVDVGWEVK